MFKHILLIVSVTCFMNVICEGQDIKFGKIQFERKINLRQQSNDLAFQERLSKNNLQFKIDLFELSFNDHEAIYAMSQSDRNIDFFNVPAQNNRVFHDFKKSMKIIQKEVFDQTFIMKDSGFKIQWKYTGELREIAGYDCKKAVAIIFDSIYVVAFYAEGIHISAGPESFHGLPGMILGLAIPRLNTTWFATKVENVKVDLNKLEQPSKGIGTDRQSLKLILERSGANWGLNAKRYLIWSII